MRLVIVVPCSRIDKLNDRMSIKHLQSLLFGWIAMSDIMQITVKRSLWIILMALLTILC